MQAIASALPFKKPVTATDQPTEPMNRVLRGNTADTPLE